MSHIALVNPQIVINNLAISYVPNSLDVDPGLGEQSVKAVAGGNGVTESVYFQNVEASVSVVKFEMYTTDNTIDFLQDWKDFGNENTIQIQAENDVVITLQHMALVNRVDVMFGNEKQTAFEFHGSPAIFS